MFQVMLGAIPLVIPDNPVKPPVREKEKLDVVDDVDCLHGGMEG